MTAPVALAKRVSDERVAALAHKPWLVLTDRTNMDTVLALASDLQDARKMLVEREAEIERLQDLNHKFMWQVKDTCARAEAAEAKLASVVEAVRRPPIIGGSMGLYDLERDLPRYAEWRQRLLDRLATLEADNG